MYETAIRENPVISSEGHQNRAARDSKTGSPGKKNWDPRTAKPVAQDRKTGIPGQQNRDPGITT